MCIRDRSVSTTTVSRLSSTQTVFDMSRWKRMRTTKFGMIPDFIFSLSSNIFSSNLNIWNRSLYFRDWKTKGEMHTRGSVKGRSWNQIEMVYEYQLAYVSAPHYPHFPLINTSWHKPVCVFSPTCQGFQSTCCFNDSQIFCLPSSLVRSLSVSNCLFYLRLYLLHHLPLRSAYLSFMTCHYIHFQVCLQKYPRSHTPFYSVYIVLILVVSLPLQLSVYFCILRMAQSDVV